ncbi:hypothetical protein IAE35_05500 [Pseudomonas sp. S75]|uniref:hypothetical protein n=1 Tax=unclassified Pseudomonas TaxID=196821 RepID=UPI00190380F1|nr:MULTISPECIES: hypothetical protein [unclassified Pseudomonas]MBJ9975239.1 hypothetical protein [Pseudomonas sp. S30]MBK0152787.1 hypothetical protein [Pseudomonas sp. S75]
MVAPHAEQGREPTPSGTCILHRVTFTPGAAPRDQAARCLVQFEDPHPAYAVLLERSPLAHMQALPEDVARDDLLMVFASAGLQTSHAWRQTLEAWIRADDDVDQPTLETMSFGERILWRPGRALIIGNPERCEELLAGIVAFSWYEGCLRGLETDIAAFWSTADDDIELTHMPCKRHQARSSHVDACVTRTTRWRMAYTRLETCLEKAPTRLSSAVRRLYNELAMQTDVHDRLVSLDDRIEVLQDLYELATDRLSEHRHVIQELRVEWLIVALLLVEAALSVWQWLT